MFELCGYETVIRGSSPYCSLSLFSADEWLSYEYASDLKYFHNVGYGRDLSITLGMPWVNASFAVLNTSTTSTISTSSSTSSSTTVGTSNEAGQNLYISFTHREVPPMILTTLGLYNNSAYTGSHNVNETMPQDRINYNRVWKSSEILPFLTNVGIERMSCDSYGFDEGDYYRILVNDGPMPLVDCRDGPGGSCSGRKFGEFIRGRSEGFAGYNEGCGGDYSEVLSIYS